MDALTNFKNHLKLASDSDLADILEAAVLRENSSYFKLGAVDSDGLNALAAQEQHIRAEARDRVADEAAAIEKSFWDSFYTAQGTTEAEVSALSQSAMDAWFDSIPEDALPEGGWKAYFMALKQRAAANGKVASVR